MVAKLQRFFPQLTIVSIVFLVSIILRPLAVSAQDATASPTPTPSVELPAPSPTATPTPGLLTPSPGVTDTITITATVQPTSTPEPTGTIQPAETSLPTITSLPSATTLPSDTIQPSATPQSTATPTALPQPTTTPVPNLPVLTPQPSKTIFFPLVIRPAYTVLSCRSRTVAIPDNNSNGAADSLHLSNLGPIHDIDVRLDISHTWIGDLAVYLTNQHTGHTITLLDRPKFPDNSNGCSGDNVRAILDDEITLSAENQCDNGATYSLGGIFRPNQAFSSLAGEPADGDWTLRVADLSKNDTGSLKGWCVRVTLGNIPNPVVNPPAIPSSARVNGVPSHPQSLPLDCEARVAVDYAAFFGYHIGEMQFFNHTPKSDDPDKGFVGNVNGLWGQIPPHDYGVHAEPVAELLRSYGVSAYAHRPLSWDDLRAEIAASRPVYVWVVGSVYGGYPVYYTAASNSHLSIVAPKEHVVMVVGYTAYNVTIQDNGQTYTRSIGDFLTSWSAMDNMAIISHP